MSYAECVCVAVHIWESGEGLCAKTLDSVTVPSICVASCAAELGADGNVLCTNSLSVRAATSPLC